MSKRNTSKSRRHLQAQPRASERPAVIHSSLYLPEGVYEALRKVAFDERVKIHDLVMEGINAVLRHRGYGSVEAIKAGRKRRSISSLWPRARVRVRM